MTTTTDVRPATEKSGRASTAARPVRWWSGRVSFRMHRRTALVSGGALLLAALLLLVSLCVGSYPVPVPDVARALFYGTGDRLAVHFVNQERLPQALLAILAGCALGMSGAIFQSVSRNALASPDVIGFNSGAATGAILVIVTFGGAAASVAAGAIAGGLVTALLVSVLASRGGLHGIRLVLIGLGVTAMLGSVNSYLLTRSSLNDAQNAHIWLVGTLNGRGWSSVQIMAVALLLLVPLALLFGRRLRMMELGDDLATGLGVRVNRSRLALTVLGIGLCGVAVASAGPIPFIALAAPQIAVMVSRSPGVSLVSAGAVGAGLLSAAHLASSQFFSALVWADRQVGWIQVVEESQRNNLLPVGVTTAVLGGVYLAWVLFKRRGTGTA
ncbi:iron chelate uptake ABC transporter family permease subunit [Streptomyces sp. MBT56]|uniref:FecCD family ABC transporter permease n=1 Tax=unclassified Streptomyces TaxID=2593676 RepID=UPI00190CA232|nr:MULTISPECIES: iron chelate uptake ABC transporter family permease subunit [unclassified Streptomyces]MBK3560709.1 iron chelate uptake ABC transporter family permease subunit [Streptomyces sp. MBT56]MBK3604222.1 iron chelate uptake ABC transporter family permease subunit [Streptomyces sp. MBT54]MBK3616606.1 iron chelate uptake ABC transporter family permease subunit [Streptomyces sp. MBT98]MBK6046141.1 iron chelate uptake ABC transporter family permease subunit [Streptomyces sp. MBT55]